MLTIRAMSSGRGYAAHHLVHSDYYTEGHRVVGYWQGRGAAELGLTGEVTEAQFEAIRQGLHPDTGEFLRPRHSADRLGEDGHTESRGRHLYDFTISAPKSVSVMATVGQDDRLIDAHQRAVDEALHELEAWGAARVRTEGANENRLTGNLVLAVYHHDTSRELDPQLHTHAVAGNLTYDGAEGRWKALQASEIYQRRAYLTEVYRNALAREVRGLGYEIDDRQDRRGHDAGFEIRGVSPELLQTYSQRSQQRDRAVERFTERTGRRPTDNEVAILVRDSRPDKLVEISTDAVRARQLARLSVDEAQALTHLREHASDLAQRSDLAALDRADRSVRYAEDHVFERRSVAHDHELLTDALRHGRGHIALEEAKGVLRLEETAGRLLRAGHEIATRESLDRERAMIAAVNHGMDRFERLGGDLRFMSSDRLRPEQRQAIDGVLDSHDRVVNLRGAAGTGKTATLEELHRGLVEGGREVLAVAPTTSAVSELEKVGFASAMTVQRLLEDEQSQATLHEKVLIVDEAGLVSARQMVALLALAERQEARVIFSGDTRQLQSVDAGDALRVLERESGLRSVSLSEVQRQTTAGYRDAIEALRQHPRQGFAQLDQLGAVHEVAWADRARTVAHAWRETHAHPHACGMPRSVLVVCATHDEIREVTAAIRDERQQAGELGQGVTVERYVPLHYTMAQKRDPQAFQTGQVLVFHRATRGVHRHEALEVVRIEPDRLVARSATGVEHGVTRGDARAFDVYERRPIEIAPHDRVLLTANRREPSFRATNGETVTISRVDKQGRLHLEDGRTLPAHYKEFDHGYAVTAHRSQGKTVDAVVIAAERMSRELFYVAASRGREQVTVVTTDKALLQDAIARSGARPSVSELVRKVHVSPDHGERLDVSRGLERGISVAALAQAQPTEHERGQDTRARPAPAHEQAIEPAVDGGQRSPAQQIERGRGYGISL
jgi:conjugative relaxase-like TrwC/TraI family protein